jgi:putative heme-binding domain-containing protein
MSRFSLWSSLLMCTLFVGQLAFAGQLAAQWTPETGLRMPEGFQLTPLYKVPGEQGSWVSLTTDPQGRLIASDQYGKLYRITLDAAGNLARVQAIQVDIGRAHGLLCAFGALYVMAHQGDGKPSGLYRVTDTNNNDEYDKVELLREIGGEGEHGPHAITLSPDGKSLYICAGNHTQLPEISDSRVPRNWQEDQLLPRMWDAGGHAVGIMAPGGWVAKIDPDGKSMELVSSGYRNEYDIAFDPNGELFTFDSDMEWDVGLPWYRPTRVCHVTSGSEFGWRSGSGKWPTYYPDSLPPVVDIGTASPTGVVFGTGAKFPAKYQHALYIADWSYGILYAIHLQPDGSTFRGEREVFCTAPGLAVTDLVVHPNGSMYFLIGGRQSQSALFRIDYRGSESTAAASYPEPTEAAMIRRHLESLHQASPDQAEQVVKEAWPMLKHADRFIRYAARVALERMPVASWRERIWGESDPQAILEGCLALTRCGQPEDQMPILTKLQELHGSKMSREQQLHLLRTVGLCFIRLGEPSPEICAAVDEALSPMFPSGDTQLDRETCRLLVAVQSPQVAAKAVEMLVNGRNQEDQIMIAYCLRPLRTGWTPELREKYFQWFLDAGSYRGGNSFRGFLQNMRSEAVATLADAEKEKYAVLTNRPIEPIQQKLPEETRPVVKNWGLGDFSDLSETMWEGRNLKNGEQMFVVGQCYKCHQISGSGGSVGPDLTAAGRRFNPHDLLETLVDPSKEVSDQYRATTFQMDDGRLVTGRIANLAGGTYMIQTNMLDPGNFTNLNSADIEDRKPSTVSMMPKGLLDTMSKDDVLDLLAYLRAASDAAMGANGGQR